MNLPINPYIAGHPVGGTKNFVGRNDVLDKVSRVLAARDNNDNAIVLYGQRRIGKTSILLHLFHRLPQEYQCRSVYFDLQDRAALSLTDVLNDLALDIAKALEIDLATDTRLTPETFKSQFLANVLKKLRPNTKFVVLFDEFDMIDNLSDDQARAALFPYLCQLMKSVRPHMQFVFVVGRQFDDLPRLGKSALKGLQYQRISLFRKEDSQGLVRLSEQNNNTLTWSQEAIDLIWELTHGHPYLIQQLCSVIWDELYRNSDERREVLPKMVEAAIPKTLERSVGTLQWIWHGLSPAQRVAASALAETGSGMISLETVNDMLTLRGVQVKEVRHLIESALGQLKEWDFLESANEKYRFRVELWRQWVLREKPLLQSKVELDRIKPEAERLFKEGEAYYEQNQLEQAANQLIRALQINKYHLRARLLLGRIRLEQEQISEAVRELEIAYQYDPVESASGYVKVLLALADSQTPEKQDQTYQRILKVEPKQPLALKMRATLAAKEARNKKDQKPPRRSLIIWVGSFLLLTVVIVSGLFIMSSEFLVAFRSATPTTTSAAMVISPSPTSSLTPKPPTATLPVTPTTKAKSPTVAPTATSTATPTARPTLVKTEPIVEDNYEKIEALHKFDGQTGRIWSLAFNPDGTLLASAASDHTVYIWDVASGEIRHQLTEHLDVVYSVAFSPDGKFLATGSKDTTIRLWDVESGKSLKVLTDHTQAVRSVVFSPDGTNLASGAQDQSVRLWNVESGELIGILTHDTDWILTVAFSPDGKQLASGDEDNFIHLWDISDEQPLQRLEGHEDWVWDVAFSSADGGRLLSASRDSSIRLWNPADGETSDLLKDHTESVNSAAFSSDGAYLLSGADDQTIRLWDVASGRLLKTLEEEAGVVSSVAFSPNSQYFASASRSDDKIVIRLWGVPLQK